MTTTESTIFATVIGIAATLHLIYKRRKSNRLIRSVYDTIKTNNPVLLIEMRRNPPKYPTDLYVKFAGEIKRSDLSLYKTLIEDKGLGRRFFKYFTHTNKTPDLSWLTETKTSKI